MPWSLIASTALGATNSGLSATTGAINTTGASLLIAQCSSYGGAGVPTITDPASNTWIQIRTDVLAGAARSALFYVANPTPSASHTFTATLTASYPSICVAAFGGGHTAPLDQQNGANSGFMTAMQPGSITPAENNELIVTGICLDGPVAGVGIDLGFTILDAVAHLAAEHMYGALAYLIQSTAGPVNPSWSWTNSVNVALGIASFKVAAGPTGPASIYQLIEV